MSKTTIGAILLSCHVATYAHEIELVNTAPTNVTLTAFTFPVGAARVENTEAIRTAWAAVSTNSLEPGTSYQIHTDGVIFSVTPGANNVDNYNKLMIGFGFVFIIGLTALGAKWVRRVLFDGGSNE